MSTAESGIVSAQNIAACFNHLFGSRYNVRMSGGAAEPDYQPAGANRSARIYYRSDYPCSALHEAAHWCIAGPRRRQLADYGYWYQPPPRSAAAQQAFAGVEAKVQGLEAIFSEAVALSFQVSIDDVDSLLSFEVEFSHRVAVECERWRSRGLPTRARDFQQALIGLRRRCADHG